ncbi:hypothetical protein EJV47_24585 [Hymenobacter gummosus]|uniref:Barstar (barnase inhibitor) domain-containing protein n=1 Tax=Hymenobacter gummosus TaxID=1776032 RepID=A0A431TWF4_9BACT|nr:barstar family protein [Hymenobacter gummosus]RTQ45669.1 hypothetical protein EJV47_24585 [Hymenobacter gummosus]
MSTPGDYHYPRDQNVAVTILARGGVRFYYQESVLDYDVDLISEQGYQILEFEGNFITTKTELLFDLEQKLHLPDWGVADFDALIDCLREWHPAPNGTALVFRHLNSLPPDLTHTLLDILSHCSRAELAWGNKLIVLVQVDNPRFAITKPLGAINFFLWNDKEWFESERIKSYFQRPEPE